MILFGYINQIFYKLRNEELGKIHNDDEKMRKIYMIKELTKFSDMWIPVSLQNPQTK